MEIEDTVICMCWLDGSTRLDIKCRLVLELIFGLVYNFELSRALP